MSLALTMMVRDEIDIVACNIAHHLDQGVCEVIVTDNGSVDGTRDLLASLARSAPITIVDEPPSDWSQGKWVTRMARMAHDRFHAQWVINGDADEFFVAPGSNLGDALESTSAGCDLLWVSRNDFVPIDRPHREAPPLEMIHRKRESLNHVSMRRIAPKAIHRGAGDVVVVQGCRPRLATASATGTRCCCRGSWTTNSATSTSTGPTCCASASRRARFSRTRNSRPAFAPRSWRRARSREPSASRARSRGSRTSAWIGSPPHSRRGELRFTRCRSGRL